MTTIDKDLKPPQAKKIPRVLEMHGHKLEDPYAWMKDRKNPEVLAYLDAENAYTESKMKSTEAFQKKLYDEILGRIKETDLSVPVRMDDYFYYTRTEKDKQYAIACRKKGSLEAPEEIILDMNELAKGHSYFALGTYAVSPNHELLAYATDTTGAETYTIHIKDLKAGNLLSDEISNCATGLEWCKDNQTFFYTVQDETKRPYRVLRHRLGTQVSEDPLIFHEKDQAFGVSLGTTKSRKYIFLSASSSTTSEVRFLKADEPLGSFRLVQARQHLLEYALAHHEDRFFVLTNLEAQNFRLMETSEEHPEKENWKEVIGHRPSIKLEAVDAFENFLVLYERENGLMKIRIRDFRSSGEHYLDFPEPVYTAWGGSNPDYRTKLLRFGYTSLITPSSVFDYDMEKRTKELKKESEVLGGYDRSLYQTERIYAVSHDGAQVPISLVYRKDLGAGPHPLFLYGYGSYGISIDPEFSSIRLSLLDRGFVYAIAHIRGGGDLGRPWYDNGKLFLKKNTFADFIAASEHLIQKKFTSKNKLVIYGGSAGGLLMGTVLNERPELFHAAIAKVPFVDIMNTMLDKTLPLTVGEFEEWGNPEDPKVFEYILSYSPYDNVKAQAYPHLLITTGLNDPRVQYWEPAKWTAKLRAMKTDSNDLLFKIDMGAGHGGPSGRYEHLKEIAFDYAFILIRSGISH